MHFSSEKGEHSNLYEEYVCDDDLDDTEDTSGYDTQTSYTDNNLRNVVKELCGNEANYVNRLVLNFDILYVKYYIYSYY